MSPRYIRLPDYAWEHEPDDEELGWDDDIPVNYHGEIDEGAEDDDA